MPYSATIGLEIHAQLRTQSKIFSPEGARYGEEPNTQVDVVSLAHPGTLPVLNGEAVRMAVRLGLAVGSTIAPRSILARKQYFYPDLPKGYQISQYDTPICDGGSVDIGETPDAPRAVRLTRIHLEEDAGKSIHDGATGATLLDFNRCGTPLVEIVTEPDLHTPEEAGALLARMRQLVRYLGICDGNLEEGSMRCDANVSIRPEGQETLGTKAEVKNLNSIRNVERAIAYEIERQQRVLDSGEAVVQETRLWDADAGVTRSMRGKEEAHDYRYFPDPDLVPVVVTDALRDEIAAALPELPAARLARYTTALGLPLYDARLLTEDRATSDYFDAVLTEMHDPSTAKAVSNIVTNDVRRVLSERNIDAGDFPITPRRLAEALSIRLASGVSSTGFQTLFAALLERDVSPARLATELDLLQVSDDDALRPLIEKIVAEHPAEAQRYRDGEHKLIGFFVGQTMRQFDGSADPKKVRELLVEVLRAAG